MSSGGTSGSFDFLDSFLKQVAGVEPATVRPRAGDRFGGPDNRRFELIQEISYGAQAAVFRAMDTRLEREVAVKVILSPASAQDPRALQLARIEGVATARLAHENVVRVFDLTELDGRPIVVMEYLRGRTLRELLAREAVSVPDAVALARQVTAGLMHAHEHGVVHRDLKPRNVFLVLGGAAKILDFGIALLTSSGEHLESPCRVAGTPSYMAPEQWRGDVLDARTDLWAVGVMLFEMLTRRRPFEAESLELLQEQICGVSKAPRVTALMPEVPVELSKLVERLLEKDVRERVQSAEELQAGLIGIERRLHASGLRTRGSSTSVADVERRQVTLLLARATPSATAGSEPEDLALLLEHFEKTCSALIYQYGGYLLSQVSGEVLACFGYPTSAEDAADCGVSAAVKLIGRPASAQGNAAQGDGGPSHQEPELALKVGLLTDLVLISPSGEAAARVSGGAFPIIRAMLDAAPRGSLVICGTTKQLVCKSFVTQSDIELDVAGVRGGVHVVQRRVEPVSRSSQSKDGDIADLVGRTRELSSLSEHWESARQGSGRSVLLLGEAGIGKSRLVDALVREVGEQNVVLAQCSPRASSSPLRPVLALLRQCVSERQRTEGDATDALLRLVKDCGLPVDPSAAILADLLDLGAYRSKAPHVSHQRLLELLANVLVAAAQCPRLFIIEDLHWADPSTLDFIDLWGPRLARSSCMLLSTARERLDDARFQSVPSLSLGRLSREDAMELIRGVPGSNRLDSALIARLAERAEGVPLFLRQVTLAVLELPTTELASAHRGEIPLGVPNSLRNLLRMQLDGLVESDRALVRAASIIGREFSPALLATILGVSAQEIGAGLARLIRAGIIQLIVEPSGSVYRFQHSLLQDAAYESLSRSSRREYHFAAGEALASDFAETLLPPAELLAHHFEAAGQPFRAIEYLSSAAHSASERCANAEAITLFERALALVPELPNGPARDSLELELLLGLGTPLTAAFGYAAQRVEETYGRALVFARRLDRPAVRAFAGLWHWHFSCGHFEVARELASRTVATVSSGDDSAQLLGSRLLGTTLFAMGDLRAALACFERVVQAYDFNAHGAMAFAHGVDPAVAALSYSAWANWLAANPVQAREDSRRALALAERVEHAHTSAFVLSYAASFAQMSEDIASCRELADRAFEISSEHNFMFWLAWSTVMKGWVAAAEGDAEGLDVLKRGIALWRENPAIAGLTYFFGVLADAYLRLGRLREARTALDSGLQMAHAFGESFYIDELSYSQGVVALRSGEAEYPLARACFERAARSARGRGANWVYLRASLEIARLDAGAVNGGQPKLEALPKHLLTAEFDAALALLHGESRSCPASETQTVCLPAKRPDQASVSPADSSAMPSSRASTRRQM